MPNIYLSPSTQEHNQTVIGKSEENIMQEFARAVGLAIYRRTDKIGVYCNRPEMTLSEIIADSNQLQPDLHLALHSNASPSDQKGKGSGTETWAWPQGTNSHVFGSLLQQRVVAALGLPDRGVKDGRHLAEVGDKVKATSVLIEVYFHDNQSDMEAFRARYSEVRDAVADCVLQWFGIPSDPPDTELDKLRRFKVEVQTALKKLEG